MGFSERKDTTTSEYKHGDLFNLGPVRDKGLEVSFNGADISSEGGLLLLKECEQRIGIVDAIAACVKDIRHQSYIDHTYKELIAQRVFQIAAGYEDANDCNSLKSDNIIKLCAGRSPQDNALGSQPTMCRLENSVTNRGLYDIAVAVFNNFMGSYSEEPKVIILDADDSDYIAHGSQQLTLYNDYYGEYCFMPLYIFEGLSGKMVTTILKPGRRSKNINVFAILKRVVSMIRSKWAKVRIIIRGDSHFCCHQLMDWCGGQKNIDFITGITANAALNRLAKTTIESAKGYYKKDKKPVKFYHSFEYKAEKWVGAQRVIVKVEMGDNGLNVRYIVTNLREYRTKHLYEKCYCARGAMELRIKEHKTYLKSDRMSCSKFSANQFRLFMHTAAYILMHNLQTETLRGTEFATATFKTIREKIIKVAAYVKELKTKIKIELPASFPQKGAMARSLAVFEVLRT